MSHKTSKLMQVSPKIVFNAVCLETVTVLCVQQLHTQSHMRDSPMVAMSLYWALMKKRSTAICCAEQSSANFL